MSRRQTVRARPSSSALSALFLVATACLVMVVATGAAAQKGTDFFYYFVASRMVVQGHGGAIYSLQALGNLERLVAYPVRVPGGVLPNVSPPFFALALAPLTRLPYFAAYLTWMALNAVLLALCLVAVERYAGLSRRTTILLRSATLASLPVIVALLQGQLSIILLAGLTGGFLCLRADKEWIAGISLAALLIKPQFLLPFVAILALRGRWRPLVSLAACAVGLAFVSSLILGLGSQSAYAATLLSASHWGSEVGGFAPHWNRSFAGFSQLLLPSPWSSALAILADLGALVILVRFVRAGRRFDHCFGLATIVALLVSQHVLIHDLTLLLLPIGIMLQSSSSAHSVRLWATITSAYALVLVGFPLAQVSPLQLPTIGMCLLGLWFIRGIGGATRPNQIHMSAPGRGVVASNSRALQMDESPLEKRYPAPVAAHVALVE
jgi:hypothetical protein